jgi:hypothetical protein
MENINNIVQFMHCTKCIDALVDNIPPREFARIEIGFTVKGFQVWCVRHDENIANFDLMGNKIEVIQ